MIKNEDELWGRIVPSSQVNDALRAKCEKQSAISIIGSLIHCNRCGFECEKQTGMINPGLFYCRNCIELGRLASNQELVGLPEPNHFAVPEVILTWEGTLTKQQKKCSKGIINSLKKQTNHLLWAVTGAGKTEMLFPVIEWAAANQKRIAIASPRVDVCLELYPRFCAAFQNIRIALLHGKQEKDYQYCQLTICTTHQLMRFREAFDILIIDEVDAFPFINNSTLNRAARLAVKKGGNRVFLSATPTKAMRSDKQLAQSYLPLRFHGFLLPQIKLHLSFGWKKRLSQGYLPSKMLRIIKNNLKRNQRFLLFAAKISDLEKISRILHKNGISKSDFATVYSSDPERVEKVIKMRDGTFRFLVTTTILERGVTFPDIDVLILGADEAVFSASSLVQIAGRVGRKKTRPTGNVDYFISQHCESITDARQQIAHMNRLGERLKNDV